MKENNRKVNIPSKDRLPEAEWVSALQKIVAGFSDFLHSQLISHGAKTQKQGEINLVDGKSFPDDTDIENYCRLSSLILLLQHISVKKLNKEKDPSALKHLNKTYHQLPNNILQWEKQFRKEIKQFFESVDFEKVILILKFPSDIIGVIYNKFSFSSHHQSHGQHFTQTNETDIINGFCIKKNTQTLMDPSCGAGSFLVRSLYFLDYFKSKNSSPEIKKSIIGVDVSPFAVYLSTVNFVWHVGAVNFTKEIIPENFLRVSNGDKTVGNKVLPIVDACIGNPPFIRQEKIECKQEWVKLIKENYGLSYINGQSDFYIYFLIHASYFLKKGGRLGWVISASWLDIQIGAGLQLFLLNHFKIIAIIDFQASRSFETASVNTILLIIEKCSSEPERNENLVKFVRLFTGYENFIGELHSGLRIKMATDFAKKIENCSEEFTNSEMQVLPVSQQQLRQNSIFKNKYENGYWGAKYLRSPEIYNKIIAKMGNKFCLLSHFADVKYGIKTGANDFFYVKNETYKAIALPEDEYKNIFGQGKQKHLKYWNKNSWVFSALLNKNIILENEFLLPVFKTQQEAVKLDVNPAKLRYCLVNCDTSLERIKEKHIYKYIKQAENQFEIHKRPSVSGRKLWYNLSSGFATGEFIFPSKIGEKYRLIDNRNAKVVCDKVNYVIIIKEPYKKYADELFLILNSIYFRYQVDLFSRQLTGSQTLSDVDVNLLKKIEIPDPAIFKKMNRKSNELIKKLKSREQLPLSKEIKMEDKISIDTAILSIINMNGEDVKELYKEAAEYVDKRQRKSDSFKK